jgi:phenylpropionate dioxygenase-like ring-hydroxylating dioxygenase large terminal subunit
MAYDHTIGSVINPDAKQDSLEAKVHYIDNGRQRFDSKRYYCKEFMQQEHTQLWTKVWQIAGVESDIPDPGDFLVYTILHEQILVVRQDDNSIKAFYNVCPHRGNRIALTDFGSVANFTCAFHSWQFRISGELKQITDEDTFRPEVVRDRPGLKSVLSETLAGIIFINLDPDAAPLEQRIGLPEGYLEGYKLNEMHVVRHIVSEWGSNWKTGVDAFYESYHLHAVHPETQTVMGDLNVQYDLYPHGSSRMIVPLGQKSPRVEDQESVDEGLEYMLMESGLEQGEYQGDASGVRQAMQASKRKRAAKVGLDYSDLCDGQLTDSWATGIFPNVQIGLHPEGAFLMRFMPHPNDPERFYYDTMTLFRTADDPNYTAPGWMGIPEGTDMSGDVRPDIERTALGEPPNLGLVLDQDADLLPVVQQGVRSQGFDGPLWGEQEQRLRHFHTELDTYISGIK